MQAATFGEISRSEAGKSNDGGFEILRFGNRGTEPGRPTRQNAVRAGILDGLNQERRWRYKAVISSLWGADPVNLLMSPISSVMNDSAFSGLCCRKKSRSGA